MTPDSCRPYTDLPTNENHQYKTISPRTNSTDHSRLVDKVDSKIVKVLNEISAISGDQLNTGQMQRHSTHFVRIDENGMIETYILTAHPPTHHDILKLNDLGIQIKENHSQKIQALVPIQSFEQLSDLPFVFRVQPPEYAIR